MDLAQHTLNVLKDTVQDKECYNLQRISDFICGQYQSKVRHYHNDTHIIDILEKLQVYLQETDTKFHVNEVRMALLLHDVIYDQPNLSAISNEEKSAQIFTHINNILSFKDDFKCGYVTSLIQSTEHANPDLQVTHKDALEYQIVHDLDFSSLGKSYYHFIRDGEKIQQEFWFAPLEDFKIGRKAFLEHMLQKEHIFLTDYFKEKYEQQARYNLQRSLEKLSQSLG